MENINKEKRSFRELVREYRIKPHESIITKVDFDTHPFRGNKFFSFSPNKLAFDEFAKCYELMQNRMPTDLNSVNQAQSMQLMRAYSSVLSEINLIESNSIETLEELAVELVRDLYSIPDNVDLKAFLRPMGEIPLGGDDEGDGDCGGGPEEEEEEISEERKIFLDKEIQKRLILNSLVHGSSIHIWKSSYHIVREQLNVIDERLIGLYDKYSSLVSFLMWQFSVEMMQGMIENGSAITQGSNKVEFAENEEEEEDDRQQPDEEDEEEIDQDGESEIDATLTGYAINFPVLLHELSKSVIDYLITNGIPQDLTKKEYAYYYSNADRYRDEIWHYFFGPTLWVNLLQTVEMTPDELPYVISKMSELEYEELAELCNLIIYDKARAKRRMEILDIL